MTVMRDISMLFGHNAELRNVTARGRLHDILLSVGSDVKCVTCHELCEPV